MLLTELGRSEIAIQYAIEFSLPTTEWIDVCDLPTQINLPPFDAKGNVFFPLGTAARSRVRLAAGDVAVLFPNDAHAPCLRVEDVPDALVRKVVIKIKDAHLAESSGNLPCCAIGDIHGRDDTA